MFGRDHWPPDRGDSDANRGVAFGRDRLQDLSQIYAELRQRKDDIQNEINVLREKKSQLEKRSPDAECERMFMLWGGCEIVDSTESSLNIKLLPFHQGRVRDSYSVSFCKPGPFWVVHHINLPYSITNFRERVAKADLSSVHRLADFIRCLQHEVNLFVWRRAQITEAKSLDSPSLSIHNSVSFTEVQLACHVNDCNGSELSKAFVSLHYQSHKYLPVHIEIEFHGGSEEDHEAFKNQVFILAEMPLKEALSTAFAINTTSTVNSWELNTRIQSEPSTSSSSSAKENERTRPRTKAELKQFRPDSAAPFMPRTNTASPRRRKGKSRSYTQFDSSK